LESHPDVVEEGGKFYKDLDGFAMKKYAYYQCWKCKVCKGVIVLFYSVLFFVLFRFVLFSIVVIFIIINITVTITTITASILWRRCGLCGSS
jgi:hypothetical protein